MKIGIFLNGQKMMDYDIKDYELAIEALIHAYQDTGMVHELKFIQK